MKKAVLQVRDLTLEREEKKLLDGVSFTLHEKKILCVIGPTGSGKGLLLKTLMGIHRGNLSGEIIKEPNVRMGMMSRAFPAIEEFTVFENLTLIAKMRGIGSQTHLAEEIEEALKKVDMWSEIKTRLHVKVEKLKFFEKIRLNLARSILLEPKVLALYRPTVNLDTDDQARFEAIIDSIREDGMGILWVSNDLEQVARVADEILFLKKGKMVEFGPCERIFTTPKEVETEMYVSRRVYV